MDAYVTQIRRLENKFYGLEFHHVVRADNQAAGELSKLGSSRAQIPHGIFIEDLLKPSIEMHGTPATEQQSSDQLVASVLTTDGDWRLPFIRYLATMEVPQDTVEMERLIQ